MSVTLNQVRRGFYMDSVALLRLTREIAAMPHIEQAGLLMGTPSNKEILQAAGLLGAEGRGAAPGDLVIAVRARDEASAKSASERAALLLEAPRQAAAGASAMRPRTLAMAVKAAPGANLALISVPGPFAAAEGRKALEAGLNVLLFSDNVPIEDEVRLKTEARARGLLLMGPDCGTAIINGVPLAFANRVRRGDIGIVGASGTGIQEVSTLIDRLGKGISHAIGTGGRDLKVEVGGITTMQGIDLLDADPATHHIVIISKPPAEAVTRKVLDRVARSAKTFTLCFIGAGKLELPRNARQASLLEEAAEIATGESAARLAPTVANAPPPKVRKVRGLFCGGTLCAEAQVVLQAAGIDFSSNVPIPGARNLQGGEANVLMDLGEDEFTRGRPHPMLEPAVRDAPLLEAFADPSVEAILLDVVLGLGSHPRPGAHLAAVIASASPMLRPLVVASITGTAADPQDIKAEEAALRAAGVVVTASAAAAARVAARAMKN
ncbi:MAG: acyl-CoA synthetase FdrA [Hyphomicrobiaceae bacterium]|nr:MAG: acyl-CoA synthetase FdrA [Hyphomicrobiaceae bacterium]